MNWLNLHTSSLRAPEFLGCEPVARATWLCVLGYSIEQENGGRIVGAAAWKDRQWQQTCGVTFDEIHSAEPLLVFDGNDLMVWGYPANSEERVRTNRANASRGGRSKSQAKAEAARVNGAKRQPNQPEQPNPSDNPSEHPSETQAITQRKDKDKDKGKDKEKIAPRGASFALESTLEAHEKPKRQRDATLDALATVGGGKPEEVTSWGTAIAAKAAILAVSPGTTPDEIRRRATNYRTHFDGAALTPTALAKHWAVCAAPKTRIGGRVGVEQIAEERAAETPEWLQRAQREGF